MIITILPCRKFFWFGDSEKFHGHDIIGSKELKRRKLFHCHQLFIIFINIMSIFTTYWCLVFCFFPDFGGVSGGYRSFFIRQYTLFPFPFSPFPRLWSFSDPIAKFIYLKFTSDFCFGVSLVQTSKFIKKSHNLIFWNK